jgi:hypothetical protein
VRQGQAIIYTVPPNVMYVEECRQAQAEAREAARCLPGLLPQAEEGARVLKTLLAAYLKAATCI